MKHMSDFTRMIQWSSMILAFLCLPVLVQAGEPEIGSRALQMQGLKKIAVESVQDSLTACLARIPKDASTGQLLLAEQNCQQVDAHRQSEQPALTF